MSVFHTENLENTENFKLKSIPCSLRKLHYTENINYETLELEYKKIDSVSDWPRHYKLLLGLCLYGRGYNALYEVDSNGDVLLKGF